MTPIIRRRFLFLGQFDLTVIHVGTKDNPADYPSRHPRDKALGDTVLCALLQATNANDQTPNTQDL